MCNITEMAKTTGKESDVSTNYYLCKSNEDGTDVFRMMLDGTERVMTYCVECSEPVFYEFLEFCKIASTDFCFYSTSIICGKCTAARAC